MRKLGIKKRFCVFASIFLASFIVITWCIYAVVVNFIENNNKITFYVPDGAPALACAKLLSEDMKDDGIEYSVVQANGIETFVTSSHESRKADFCVLPLTDASLLLNDGKDYQTLGVLTHGNFFLISEKEEYYTKDNLALLLGKKIGFVQLGKLPGLIFQSILKENGIDYEIVSDLGSCKNDVVNLINISPTSAVKGTGYDLFIMPEPTVTAKIEKAGFYLAGSVQELYGEDGYAQAVIVAKRSIIESKSDLVDEIVRKLRSNKEWLNSENVTAEQLVSVLQSHINDGFTPAFSLSNFSKLTWKEDITSKYGVYFTEQDQAKEEITLTISKIQQVDENIKTFADEFFKI